MRFPKRKKLPHDTPWWIPGNIEGEVYFITICTRPRGRNQLATDDIWPALEQSVNHQQQSGQWDCAIFLAMPDHVHLLGNFDSAKSNMSNSIANWKRWLARTQGIKWQRDFFDHRLRNQESVAEKASYIRMNPVRAGLVGDHGQWPYQWVRPRP